ncbi:MAG: hypothetical protein V1493_06635 [Candidatus Diapherotrites archaeon]
MPFKKPVKPIDRPVFRVPDEQGLAKQAAKVGKRWNHCVPKKPVSGRRTRTQLIIPKAQGLSEAIGINPGSKIHYFAGFTGDWARALALKNEVYYSDASPATVEWQRGVKSAGYKSVKLRDAAMFPDRKRAFRWSVSFEPIPLRDEQLALALTRSLLNEKGAKIVYGRGPLKWSLPDYAVAKEIAEIYGGSAGIETKKIGTFSRNGKIRERRVDIITLETNDASREMAWLDLQVLKAVTRSIKAGRLPSVDELVQNSGVKKLGLGRQQLWRSLERLERIKGFFKGKIGKKNAAIVSKRAI